MGNLLSYEIVQGYLLGSEGYIFNNNLLQFQDAKTLTIFYKYNNEENKLKLNSFLEKICSGLILHADDKNIAIITLKYHNIKYIIFYALYEEHIYNFLTFITDTYTFIDKEPNILQRNDLKYMQFKNIAIKKINITHKFAKKYLEEFIFTTLEINNNPELYNMCKNMKNSLYDIYVTNQNMFALKIIHIIEIKYYLMIQKFTNEDTIMIISSNIIAMQLLCNSKIFASKSQTFLLLIKQYIMQ